MKTKIIIILLLSLIAAQAFASRFVISLSQKKNKIEYRINGKKYKFDELVKVLNTNTDTGLYVYIDFDGNLSNKALIKILAILKQKKIKKAILTYSVRKDGKESRIEIPVDLTDFKQFKGLEKIPVPPEP